MLDVLMPVSRAEWVEESVNSIKVAAIHANIQLRLIVIITKSGLELESDIFKSVPFLKIIRVNSYGANYETALRAGSVHLKSEFVALMNDDDICAINRFKTQISALRKSKADISIGRMQKFGSHSYRPNFNSDFFKRYHHLFLLIGPFGANATWMMKRDWWLSRINSSTIKGEWDWGFALKYFPEAKYHYTKSTIYFYRQHIDQISRKTDYRTNLIQNMRELLLENWVATIGPQVRAEAVNLIALPYLLTSVNAKKLGHVFSNYLRLQQRLGFFSFWLVYQFAIRVFLALIPIKFEKILGIERTRIK